MAIQHGYAEKLSTTIKSHELLNGPAKSICRRDYEQLVSGYELNFIGDALAAKAPPFHDFNKPLMTLSILIQYT